MTSCPSLALVRADVRAMKPYVSARSLWPVKDGDVLLDANEMPVSPCSDMADLNRYAEQQPIELVRAVASFFEVPSERLLVSRGADEAIDILVRLFCAPGKDSILVMHPAFPMYPRAGALNGTDVIDVPLSEADFSMTPANVLRAVREDTKLVFVCSPHNPVGVSVPEKDVVILCEALKGRAMVVVDEAYVEFSSMPSMTRLMECYDNLIVLRTLSKAMGLAGARCGGLIARKEIVQEALKVLAVYPVPVPVLAAVLEALSPENRKLMEKARAEILETKRRFVARLKTMKSVDKVFPSDANFVLVRFKDGGAADALMRSHGFIARDQGKAKGLENCVRIAIGTAADMDRLVELLETLACAS